MQREQGNISYHILMSMRLELALCSLFEVRQTYWLKFFNKSFLGSFKESKKPLIKESLWRAVLNLSPSLTFYETPLVLLHIAAV